MKVAQIEEHCGRVLITCPECGNVKQSTAYALLVMGPRTRCPKCFATMMFDLRPVIEIAKKKRGSSDAKVDNQARIK